MTRLVELFVADHRPGSPVRPIGEEARKVLVVLFNRGPCGGWHGKEHSAIRSLRHRGLVERADRESSVHWLTDTGRTAALRLVQGKDLV